MYSAAAGTQQSPYQFPPYQPKPALSERVADVSKDTYTWLRDYVTAIKNGRLHPFTAVERKAREATRKDPWGPTGQQLAELADLSHHPEHAHAVLEYRLTRGPEKWRNVYKALLVLEYLLIRGSSSAVQLGHSREVQHLLASLSHFEAMGLGQGGGDAGVNVRLRSAAVLELLHDPQLLQQRRAAAAARFGQQQQQPGSIAATAAAGGGPGGYGGYSREQMLTQQQQQQYGGRSGSNAPGSYANDSYNTRYNSSSSTVALNGFQGPSPYITNARPPAAAAPPPPAAGGFGEAKGVSFEENKLRISELRQLLQREENRRCADCQDASPGGRPTWASVNLGVFICMRCAGTHRGLGAHISKVRSCTLDTWLPEQVVFMAQTGNAAANAHFEALLPRQPGGGSGSNAGGGSSGSNGSSNGVRPPRDSPEMAAFIRQKYADGKWVRPGSTWPPSSPQVTPQPLAAAAAAAAAAAGQQQQQRMEVRIGAREGAGVVPAAVTLAPPAAAAAAAAAGRPKVSAVPPPPQLPAAAAAAVADLLCLGDDSSSVPNAPSASGVSHFSQGVSQPGGGGMTNGGGGTFWDLMDAPMNVPPPNVSVIDWLDQRIQSGADAAAQAAADAARQQRHQLRHHHHQQQQQQPMVAVFDPFVGAAAGAALNGRYPPPQALQQQQQQPAQTVVTQLPAAAEAAPAVKTPGVMHSFAVGLSSAVSHMSSHMTLHRGASNIIQTYEYTFSDSDSDEEDEETGEQPAAAVAAEDRPAAVPPSTTPAAAAAAANGQPAGSAAANGSNGSNGLFNPFAIQNQQQQQQAQGSSNAGTNSSRSKKPLLIPATPGYHTSGPSAGFTGRPAAAAGLTGQSAAAGYTGRQAAAAAAAGFAGRSAAAGFTGQSAAAGYTGRQAAAAAAAAGFTGQRPTGVYAGAAFRAPVVGFSGGWGGYYGMAAPQQSVTAARPHSYSNGVTGGAGQAGMSHAPVKPNISQQQ